MDKVQIVAGLFPMVGPITSNSVAGLVITTCLARHIDGLAPGAEGHA